MAKRLLFLILFCWTLGCAHECSLIDLESAWQRILSYAPGLAAIEGEIILREADFLQASLRPNPIATIESENLGVHKGDEDEAEPPETTFALTQLIELGGKRSARRSFTCALREIAYWDAQIERQDMRFALTAAFIDVCVAQEKASISQEMLCIAEEILNALCALVDAGKISPIQAKKAQIDLRAAQISVRESIGELAQAKMRLSSLWGCPHPDFDTVLYDFFSCDDLPLQCCALQGLFQSPDYARARQVIDSSSKNLYLQKANAIPDFTFTAGYRVFHDSGQHGWIVGVEFPLPFFNRNQGNIRRASVEIHQAEYQMDEVVRVLTEKIILVHERMAAALEECEMINHCLLPEAEETLCLIQTGHQNGKIEYLELLEAEKTLFEIRERQIEILYDYHMNRAELARLTGECL